MPRTPSVPKSLRDIGPHSSDCDSLILLRWGAQARGRTAVSTVGSVKPWRLPRSLRGHTGLLACGAMTKIVRRFADINGIRLAYDEAGAGPLVLLVHGWPEMAHSWRNQVPVLAAAGYRAVAPDMRGYGESDAPAAVEDYTILHLVGDLVGLLDHLGAAEAVVIGHDWGALAAWYAALLRPDRFRAVAAMSVVHTLRPHH